jgi:hypothetical protein
VRPAQGAPRPAAGHGHPDFEIANLDLGLLDAVQAAHFLNLEFFQFLAGEREIRAADGRLHHAANGAEDLASGGAHAKRRVGNPLIDDLVWDG